MVRPVIDLTKIGMGVDPWFAPDGARDAFASPVKDTIGVPFERMVDACDILILTKEAHICNNFQFFKKIKL